MIPVSIGKVLLEKSKEFFLNLPDLNMTISRIYSFFQQKTDKKNNTWS